MHISFRELCVAVLFASLAEAGFYGGKSAVVELDGNNFQKEILDSSNAAVSGYSL